MAGVIAGQPNGGVPVLDVAEQKSWQNYLPAVLRIAALLNRELAEAHGLSLADVQLLDLLDGSADGSTQMGALAGVLGLPRSRLTRQIGRLHDHGLLARAVHPEDRRRVVVTLTPLGRTLIEQARITYANAVRTHFLGPLTRAQIVAMATACGQISDGLRG